MGGHVLHDELDGLFDPAQFIAGFGAHQGVSHGIVPLHIDPLTHHNGRPAGFGSSRKI